ncbi:HAD family hydrolase [Planobispora siamensis]|uniref:Hydrolase n=1 Tax=Planobispora siamensis TaxID=936338 RepID=A0A8J3SKP7_9ACTN|nr:HAD family phosphatase [Planobispora siamensis]GIH94104.1 hydrolase [Planobispora siamensis]
MSLRAVLFDMDGTLVDTEGLWWEACVTVAAELGLELDDSDSADVFGRLVEHVAAHLVRRSRTGTGRPAQEAVAVRLADEFAGRVAGGVTPLPGALRLLDDLGAAGVPIALVSASPRRVVDIVLRTVGADRFRLVVAAEDTERGKPRPDPYLKAAAGLGAEPFRCVAVEDSPTGIAAAGAAGCRVIAVPPGGTASTTSPDGAAPYGVLTVDSLEQVDLPMLRMLATGQISVG